MSILQCQACGQKYRLPTTGAGMGRRCPTCGCALVPESGEPIVDAAVVPEVNPRRVPRADEGSLLGSFGKALMGDGN